MIVSSSSPSYLFPCTNNKIRGGSLRAIQICLGIIGIIGVAVTGVAVAHFVLPQWVGYIALPVTAIALASLLFTCFLKKAKASANNATPKADQSDKNLEVPSSQQPSNSKPDEKKEANTLTKTHKVISLGNTSGSLPFAASKGDFESLKLLLNSPDIDLDEKDGSGCTALHNAALRGDLESVKLLKSHGANLILKNSDGQNLLSLAAYSGNFQLVEYLLATNLYNCNEKDNEDVTAVFWATMRGNLDIVQLLYQHGADLTIKSKYQMNLVHGACFGNNVKLMEFLLGTKLFDINEKCAFYDDSILLETAIEIAFQYNFLDIVKLLIDQGAVTRVIKDGDICWGTPSMSAYFSNYKEMGDFLLKKEKEWGHLWFLGTVLLLQHGAPKVDLKYKQKKITMGAFSRTGALSYIHQSIPKTDCWKECKQWDQKDSSAIDEALEQSLFFLDKAKLFDKRQARMLEAYHDGKIIIFPPEFASQTMLDIGEGHTTTIVLFKFENQGYLIKYDFNTNMDFEIYKINDENQIKTCMARLLNMKEDVESYKYYTHGLHQDLKLKYDKGIPHNAGGSRHSCTWISCGKASLKAALYAQCIKKKLSHSEAVKISGQLYKEWVFKDREQNMQDFLNLPLKDPEDIRVRHKILTSIHHYLSERPDKPWRQKTQKLIEKEKGQVKWTHLKKSLLRKHGKQRTYYMFDYD